MTRADASITVDTAGARALVRGSRAAARAAAFDANRDMHHHRTGAVRLAFISRGSRRFTRRGKARRYLAMIWDRESRRRWTMTDNEVGGRTEIDVADLPQVFGGEPAEPALIPIYEPGKPPGVAWRRLADRVANRDLPRSTSFARIAGKTYLVRKGTRSRPGKLVAVVTRRRPTLGGPRAGVDELWGDIERKYVGSFRRALKQRMSRAEARAQGRREQESRGQSGGAA